MTTIPKQDQVFPIEIGDPKSNPIMIGISENVLMGKFDVELIVGNFATKHEANAVANKLIKLVERELGSKRAKLARGH